MTNLLTIDAGNTQTVIGLFQDDELAGHWRIATNADRTADEHAMLIQQLLISNGDTAVDGIAFCSVVPRITTALTNMAPQFFHHDALIVNSSINTGITCVTDNPKEVGADLIANAEAAHTMFEGPTITVDFGTATTVSAVSAKGEYLGCAIMPGIAISLDALFERASALQRIEIVEPKHIIGRNTVESIRSGVLYGYAGQADAMVQRFLAELGEATVIATGGLAELVVSYANTLTHHEPWLTLQGLRLIWQRNI